MHNFFPALAGIDYSPVAVEAVFSRNQPSIQCASVTIIPDDIPEDFENFTVTIAEVGQYEYDETLMGVNDRVGLNLFPKSTTAIIEGAKYTLIITTGLKQLSLSWVRFRDQCSTAKPICFSQERSSKIQAPTLVYSPGMLWCYDFHLDPP